MAKQNSQVIWKLPNTIFTHPFHIKSSNEAYFSKYVPNCIDTHLPVYQPHTADIFKPAVGDPKRWRHDRAVRMPTMGISATCFPDTCHPKYKPVFVNQPLSVHIKFTPYSHDKPQFPENIIILQDFFILFSAPVGCSSDTIHVVHKDAHNLWPADLSLRTIDPLSPNTPKNRNLWFLFSLQDLSDTCVWQQIYSGTSQACVLSSV